MELRRIIQVLCDAEVEFVVIGGVAVTLHGGSRATYDFDICYRRSNENLRKLTAALAPFHPRPRDFPAGLPFQWDTSTLRNGLQFTLRTDLGEIDLLAETAGVGGYSEAHANSLTVEACDRSFHILDLRTLIAAKRAAGRPKDLSDVTELEGLLENEP